ncbi:MAG: PAS domain S-box protein [Beijerinckiaceae bacterium]|nr:PAS domain S-box protein [Beijerinckiaceae bacterium]
MSNPLPDGRLAIQILTAISDSVAVLSSDGSIRFVNDQGRSSWRAPTVNALIGRSLADLWPEDKRDEVRRAIAAAASGQPGKVEGLCQTGDGFEYWREEVFSPLPSENEQAVQVVAMARTVDEPHAAKRALHEAHSKLDRQAELNRQVLDSAIDTAIVSTDQHGIVVSWNEGARHITGWSESEMVGKPLATIFTAEDKAKLSPQHEMENADRFGRALDKRWHHKKDGTLFYADGSLTPLKGEFKGYVKCFRDATAQHRSEQALSVAQERLQLTLSNSEIIGVWDWDVARDKVYADGRFCQLFGLDAQQGVDGASVGEFMAAIHLIDRERVNGEIDASLQSGAPFVSDYRIVLPNGQISHVLARGKPMRDADGAVERFLGVLVDITDHRNTEMALRASEDELRLALKAGRFGAWRLSLVTSELKASDTFREIFGHEASAEISYAQLSAAVHVDDRERVAAAFDNSVRDGVDFDIDYRILVPSGELRWISIRAQPAYSVDGAPERLTGIALDITEKMKVETRRQALIELGERIRERLTPDALAEAAVEIAGRALGANRAGFARLDRSSSTLTTLQEWSASTAAQSVLADDWRALDGLADELRAGVAIGIADATMDDRLATCRGALVAAGVVSLAAIPLVERQDGVLMLYLHDALARAWSAEEIAFARDLGERAQMAIGRLEAERSLRQLAASLEIQVEDRTAALKANEERLRSIFETSYQYQALIGLDGALLDANATSLESIDASLETVVGKPFWSSPWFAGTEGMEAIVRSLFHRVLSGETVQQEITLNLPKGGWRWFNFSMRPISDERGEVIAVVLEAVETTERRQAEDALRQAQKMEAVGQLTGGIAHDFNNMLAGILGSAQIIQKRLRDQRYDDCEKYIEALTASANRAAALTHRLLAFSRRQTLDIKSIDVNETILSMQDLLARTLGAHISLVIALDPGVWPAASDAHQLESALLNLAINARDAMERGGELRISTANRAVRSRDRARPIHLDPGQYVSIVVEDTGIGMTPDVLKRVFDPFFTTKPIGQGTGLGLSMIYGFVNQAGGTIAIESEPEVGTVVTLLLPKSADAVDRSELNQDAAPHIMSRKTILVVEDEPLVRMMLVDYLDDLGYRVIEAKDAATALDALKGAEAVDLMLTDVGLPGGMNGRQLADMVRAGGSKLPILFATGYADGAATKTDFLGEGMDMVGKPLSLDTLAEKIATMIVAAEGRQESDDRA